MRQNYHTVLQCQKVTLVPYKPVHIEKYHKWMQNNPELLELTASEPLSMEEEISMQESWHQDENKCTFIVLASCSLNMIDHHHHHDNNNDNNRQTKVKKKGFMREDWRSFISCLSDNNDNNNNTNNLLPKLDNKNFIGDNLRAMVGDCNLFFHAHDSEEELKCAELDIMIAESSNRRNGLGTEAVCLMMLYGYHVLNVRRFYVKIGVKNNASRYMFQKIGFVECNFVECFQEFEYEYIMNDNNDCDSSNISNAVKVIADKVESVTIYQLE